MVSRRVCVVGLGYIGLPTAALLASVGHDVIGVDINAQVVGTINRGEIHIVEPDLDAFVRSAVASGRLRGFIAPQPADIYMLCVPTPFHEGDGIPQPNIDYVLNAVRSIRDLMKPGDAIILESTSPVGTTQRIADELASSGIDIGSLHIAYCPERVLPGKIMVELVENDRVVGGLTPAATDAVAEFYHSFVRGTVLKTNAATAEMCKLTENSFRDLNIAFANELSLICDRAGVDVWELIRLANHHPRVNILQPGVGVGGHCIAVDPWFIVASDPENARLIRTAREVNNHKAEWSTEQIRKAAATAAERLGRAPRIACLGLAFKQDIDDLRESPAAEIVETLIREEFDVVAVEPNIETHERIRLDTLEAAIDAADILVFLVKHREFLAVAPELPHSEARITLDLCGVLAH